VLFCDSNISIFNLAIYPGSAGCIAVKTNDFNDKIRPFLDGLRETQSFISLSVVPDLCQGISLLNAIDLSRLLLR
jgi:hypothetical protein